MAGNTRDLYLDSVGVGTTAPYQNVQAVSLIDSNGQQIFSAGAASSVSLNVSGKSSSTINLTSVPSGMTAFRLHVWDSQPTDIADNAVFSAAAADRAKYCGYVDLSSIIAIGGGFLFTFGDYTGRPVRLTSNSFWFNLALMVHQVLRHYLRLNTEFGFIRWS